MTLPSPPDPGLAELLLDTAQESGDTAGRLAALALAFSQGLVTPLQAAQAASLLGADQVRKAAQLGLTMSLEWSRWCLATWQPFAQAAQIGSQPWLVLSALDRP